MQALWPLDLASSQAVPKARSGVEVPKLSECSKMMRSLVTFWEFPMRFHAHLVERRKNKEDERCLGLNSDVASCNALASVTNGANFAAWAVVAMRCKIKILQVFLYGS